MLIGGIEREGEVKRRDRRERQAPQRRDPVEAQHRLERERHEGADRKAERPREPAREEREERGARNVSARPAAVAPSSSGE